MSAPDLGALVSARLCHDLISPMGAIGNGIELMQLSQTTHSAELDLIATSLGSALAKLRFYRIAFGAAEAQAEMSFDETRAIADAMFQGRFTVAFAGATGPLARDTARLLYLALLCLEKSLPMGGVAQVSLDAGAIAVTAEGRRTAPPAALWDLAANGATDAELRPDGVQFALLDRARVEAGYRLETDFAETRARIRMTAPALAPA